MNWPRNKGLSIIEVVAGIGIVTLAMIALLDFSSLSQKDKRANEMKTSAVLLRRSLSSLLMSIPSMQASMSHPDNAKTLSGFDGQTSVDEGPVTLLDASKQVVVASAGSEMDLYGNPCTTECAAKVTAHFTPLCSTGVPPCVTDVGRLEFELVAKSLPGTRKWEFIVTPENLGRGEREIVGGGRNRGTGHPALGSNACLFPMPSDPGFTTSCTSGLSCPTNLPCDSWGDVRTVNNGDASCPAYARTIYTSHEFNLSGNLASYFLCVVPN